MTQVKDEFGGVVVWFPAFGECGNRCERFWVILDESVVKRHVDARFGLAVTNNWIERFGFVAGDVAKDVAGRWIGFAEVKLIARRNAA